MLGSSISLAGGQGGLVSVAPIMEDDIALTYGTDSDVASLLDPDGHNANATKSSTGGYSVLVGTPVTNALAANSFILSNVSEDGDMLFATRRGANSESFLFMDASTGILYLNPTQGLTLVPAVTTSSTLGVTNLLSANGGISITGGSFIFDQVTEVYNFSGVSMLLQTTNAGAAATNRLAFTGGANTAVATWSAITHTGMVATGFGYGAETDLTISGGGAVAVTKVYHSIITAGGAADQLDTATGGTEGQILIIKPNTSGANGTVTVADATGADTFILNGGANFIMDHVDDRLVCIHNGTEWVELSRSSGS